MCGGGSNISNKGFPAIEIFFGGVGGYGYHFILGLTKFISLVTPLTNILRLILSNFPSLAM
jgi:hypothetical protein